MILSAIAGLFTHHANWKIPQLRAHKPASRKVRDHSIISAQAQAPGIIPEPPSFLLIRSAQRLPGRRQLPILLSSPPHLILHRSFIAQNLNHEQSVLHADRFHGSLASRRLNRQLISPLHPMGGPSFVAGVNLARHVRCSTCQLRGTAYVH
jgi:hypothetical protein